MTCGRFGTIGVSGIAFGAAFVVFTPIGLRESKALDPTTAVVPGAESKATVPLSVAVAAAVGRSGSDTNAEPVR
jgi:hypothetical protein